MISISEKVQISDGRKTNEKDDLGISKVIKHYQI